MSTLEKPDILNETWLDDEVACHHGDGGAAYRWIIQCCGTETFLCAGHDEYGRKAVADLTESNGRCICGICNHIFGFHPPFDTVYRRIPM